jgi:hypothetical protein
LDYDLYSCFEDHEILFDMLLPKLPKNNFIRSKMLNKKTNN